MSTEDVERLAAQAATGDQAALDRLLRQIQPEVLRQCVRFLPCRQDAEEACQDALLQVSVHLSGFQWRSTFRTWLHAVVANSARATYRRLRRHAERQLAGDELLERRPDPRTTSVIAGSRLDLLDAVERLEVDHPHLVAPFVLRDLSQLTYAEIAEQLGAPVGTVKSRVHDARAAVQRLLAERG